MRHRPATSARGQRGVVLFIALIAMVVLSLAGIGLMRSVDTGQGAVGNLAFRQASIAPVNLAIENAVDTVFKSKKIANLNADDLAHSYYASLQPGEKSNGIPLVLAGAYPPAAYDAVFPHDTDATTKIEVRSIIERVCNGPAVTQKEILERCDVMPPKVSSGRTGMKPGQGFGLRPLPHYRVTVRVDLPNTNTVTFAQAFLR